MYLGPRYTDNQVSAVQQRKKVARDNGQEPTNNYQKYLQMVARNIASTEKPHDERFGAKWDEAEKEAQRQKARSH